MARIRTIKPEFPHSESMGRVSRDARLTFIELWTLADDAGRLRGNSRMLASLLFPYDDDSKKLIEGWLGELEREKCIQRYLVDGTTYIQVCNWLTHQKIDKPSASKLPGPEDGSRILSNPREVSSEDQGSGSGSGRDQGKEGTNARATHSPIAPAEERSVKRGSRIPTPFLLTAEMRSWAKSETPDVDVEFETKEFADYWRTVPGQKGCKLDWVLTWQVRLREIQRRSRPSRRINGPEEAPKITWRPPPDEVPNVPR